MQVVAGRQKLRRSRPRWGGPDAVTILVESAPHRGDVVNDGGDVRSYSAVGGEAVLPILATFGLAAIKVVSREQLADE